MRKWSISPNRTGHVEPLRTMYATFATSWARLYRQVFWLADRRHNVERISKLLHSYDCTA